MSEFKLPSLGEGVDSGTVVSVLVSPGDAVAAEQPVVEIEADKATVELPCPEAGTVTEVHVEEGDEVKTGDPVISYDPGEGGGGEAAEEEEEEGKEEEKEAADAEEAPAREREPATARAGGERGAGRPARQRSGGGASSGNGGRIPAGPAVRRLGRLLGVDLEDVSGSGERGRITAEDVHAYLERLKGGGGGAGPAPELPDFTQWGEVERERLSGIRKATVRSMSRAWSQIPHVTQHDLVDVTDLEASRKAFRKANPDGPKVTMTAVILRAVAAALREFPAFNASLDAAREEVVLKRYVHVGVAVDTDRGLLVPVVRDADQKSILELAQELTDLAGQARDRKLGRDAMQGATFTVSNLGGIGGWGFTPIVNWPEVAILGVSRARQEYRPGPSGPEPRLIMPVSLSYDHRVIDGAAAARFTRFVGDLLEDPAALLFRI